MARPLAGIEVSHRLGRQALPPGEVGEEWSRGPNTFLGYLGEPELTAKDLDANGWYHSGDLARLLPDGSIRIAGRIKDIIVRGGQNISVREVEDYLAAHPGNTLGSGRGNSAVPATWRNRMCRGGDQAGSHVTLVGIDRVSARQGRRPVQNSRSALRCGRACRRTRAERSRSFSVRKSFAEASPRRNDQ